MACFNAWDIGGCGCVVAGVTICVRVCGNTPLAGGTVKVFSGATLVGSCTTDATGCCAPSPAVAPGTYTVQVFFGATLINSASRNLAAGVNTISVGTPSGLICCGNYYIPTTLTLTDAGGTLTMWYYGTLGFSNLPTWFGCQRVTRTSCTVTATSSACTVAAPASNPVTICYQMQCVSPSSPTLTMRRLWSWVAQQPSTTPIWYSDSHACPTGGTGVQCITVPPAACGSNTDQATGSADPSSTSPFAVTFSMTPLGTNTTTDPVGGSITVTQ